MFNPLYKQLNNLAYAVLQNIETFDGTSVTNQELQNDLFNTMINGITAVISERNTSNRGYDPFQIPVSPFGALIKQLGAKLVRADDPISLEAGTQWTDFARTPQNLIANYIGAITESNYPLQIDLRQVQRLASVQDMSGVADIYAQAYHILWESIRHDHDLMVPYMLGWLATQQQSQWRTIPETPSITANPQDIQSWGIQLTAQINAAVRNLTDFRSSSFNLLGADSIASRDDLALVAFYDPQDAVVNPADILRAYIALSAQPNVTNIAEAFNVNYFIEMPYIGDIRLSSDGTVGNILPRVNGLTAFPGMQTAEMINGVPVFPLQSIKFGLVQLGAINVGHKNLLPSTQRSARGHVDMTWVLAERQVWGGGPFQSVWFTDGTANVTLPSQTIPNTRGEDTITNP